MKKKTNLKYVEFTCDNCKAKSGERSEIDSDNYGGNHPFPYNTGWIYIYGLKLKLLGQTIEIKDAHLCSRLCFEEFIKKEFDKCYTKEVEECQQQK